MRMKEATFVIIGGGIAGVSCAEGLSFLAPEKSVILISESPVIKQCTHLKHLTKMLSEFKVEEKSMESLSENCPSVSVLHGSVTRIDFENRLVFTSEETIGYEKLCICTGSRPKLITTENPHVIGIRDTDSVVEFQKRVSSSRRMVVVGNGGIATELVHEVTGMEIIWVIKDQYISSTFIDSGAAQFFQSYLVKKEQPDPQMQFRKRVKYSVAGDETNSANSGAALGPDWRSEVSFQGIFDKKPTVNIEYSCEVEKILSKEEGKVLTEDNDWPVFVRLTNGKVYGCDFIVSATGVEPNVELVKDSDILLAEDGGIKVNWKMETSVAEVFAAGDVCSASWDQAPQWFQMRLWTQARQMGTYAAKAMLTILQGEELLQDFCFELFTHVTNFFGFKVILLGLFNGQKLGTGYEILLRITTGHEYVKLVMKDGRMQGALLIGETDIEEMCENLILNQLDLSNFGENLLETGVDMDDYFD